MHDGHLARAGTAEGSESAPPVKQMLSLTGLDDGIDDPPLGAAAPVATLFRPAGSSRPTSIATAASKGVRGQHSRAAEPRARRFGLPTWSTVVRGSGDPLKALVTTLLTAAVPALQGLVWLNARDPASAPNWLAGLLTAWPTPLGDPTIDPGLMVLIIGGEAVAGLFGALELLGLLGWLWRHKGARSVWLAAGLVAGAGIGWSYGPSVAIAVALGVGLWVGAPLVALAATNPRGAGRRITHFWAGHSLPGVKPDTVGRGAAALLSV